jgi:hypothetical protein
MPHNRVRMPQDESMAYRYSGMEGELTDNPVSGRFTPDMQDPALSG